MDPALEGMARCSWVRIAAVLASCVVLHVACLMVCVPYAALGHLLVGGPDLVAPAAPRLDRVGMSGTAVRDPTDHLWHTHRHPTMTHIARTGKAHRLVHTQTTMTGPICLRRTCVAHQAGRAILIAARALLQMREGIVLRSRLLGTHAREAMSGSATTVTSTSAASASACLHLCTETMTRATCVHGRRQGTRTGACVTTIRGMTRMLHACVQDHHQAGWVISTPTCAQGRRPVGRKSARVTTMCGMS